MGDYVLVRGHDRLPCAQGRRDEGVGGLGAAHQLDDDVRVWIGHEMGRGVCQQACGNAAAPSGVHVPDGDPDELEPGASITLQAIWPLREGADDLTTDGPRTE
jgi:hypothetical protein